MSFNNYFTNGNDDRFTPFSRETAHSLEPVNYMLDNRTGAMLAFDTVPTFRDLHKSVTSFIV